MRLYQYLWNKSIWHDEASFVLGLKNHSFANLLAPVPEGSPGGGYAFMFLEKVMLELFGYNELALRFFPFLASIVSLVLFYFFLKQYGNRLVTSIAIAYFALSDNLIYYAAEVRSYSIDLLIGLIFLNFSFTYLKKELTRANALKLCVVGIIFMWLSHTTIFIIAGVGVVFGVDSLLKKDHKRARALLLLGLSWIAGFVLFYVFSLQLWKSGQLEAFQKTPMQFIPFPPTSINDMLQCFIQFFRLFGYMIGLRLSMLGEHIDELTKLTRPDLMKFSYTNLHIILYIALNIIGVAILFVVGKIKTWQQNRKYYFILILPILLVMIASGLDSFPWRGRFLLFMFPLLIILMAEGVAVIKPKVSKYTWLLILFLLFFHPTVSACYHIVKPRTLEEVKPLIKYINQKYQEGDKVVIVGSNNWLAFYGKALKLDLTKANVVSDLNKENVNNLINKKRVWFFLITAPNDKRVAVYEGYLNDVGSQEIKFFERNNAILYLYTK